MGMNDSAQKAFYEVPENDETLTAENLAAEMKDIFTELMNARVVRIGNRLVLDFGEDEIFGVTFGKMG